MGGPAGEHGVLSREGAQALEAMALDPFWTLRRQLLLHLHCRAAVRGDPSALPGDGSWPENVPEQHRRVEDHCPLGWWRGLLQLYSEELWAAQASSSGTGPLTTSPGHVPAVPLQSCHIPRLPVPTLPSASPSLLSDVFHRELVHECGECLDRLLPEPQFPVPCSMGEMSLIEEFQ